MYIIYLLWTASFKNKTTNNDLSPQTIEHKRQHVWLKIQDMALDKRKGVMGLIGSSPVYLKLSTILFVTSTYTGSCPSSHIYRNAFILFQAAQLLSDIGGSVGLCLGFIYIIMMLFYFRRHSCFLILEDLLACVLVLFIL